MTARRSSAQWLRVACAMAAAGWGANQFAPMLLVYQERRGLTEQLVTGMFAAYIAGLVPALLGAAWASRRFGKRPMVRTSMSLMMMGSVLLFMGSTEPAWLFVGRVVAGAGVGFIMGPGTAWVTELSAGRPRGTGARRSTVALTAGFAGGPVVASALAEFLPNPMQYPYIAHLVIQFVAALIVWETPERDADPASAPSPRDVLAHLREPWFVHLVVPSAPWVFGAATVSFAVMPALVGPLPGLPRVLAAGLTAGLTLATSVLVQPTVRRYGEHAPGRIPPLGMLVTAVGMAIATASALAPHWGWLVPGSLVLGAAHGLLMVGSITVVEHQTPPHLLAPTTAVVYSLTYIGFAAPLWVSVLSLAVPAWAVLAAGILIATATANWLRLKRQLG